MMHKPIQVKNISLSFPHKICFENFTSQILSTNRIGIIGRNGSGKSTLLKMIMGLIVPTEGSIDIPQDIVFGYVPQIVETFEFHSGGERLNKALTKALSLHPNVLLLDEPTNHLDLRNRKTLIRMLSTFTATLIIVSHDVECLRTCVDTIWHIDPPYIHIFHGDYDDYFREIRYRRSAIEQKISDLNQQKKATHAALMKEQERTKKRKAHGEKKYAGDKISLRSAQGRGQMTSNKKRKYIHQQKESTINKLQTYHLPKIILPKFSLNEVDVQEKTVLSISHGSVSYDSLPILRDINLTLGGQERIAIKGDNGSGKSTLFKAIRRDAAVKTSGNWHLPRVDDIGYLDQHYATLNSEKTALEIIHDAMPENSYAEIRQYLNDFLFRKNEEVNALVSTLSGGERVRLSLCQIAAKTPRLLLLDEITNNLDLETREYVIQVLNDYPGALIIISHDEDFLKRIRAEYNYKISGGSPVIGIN